MKAEMRKICFCKYQVRRKSKSFQIEKVKKHDELSSYDNKLRVEMHTYTFIVIVIFIVTEPQLTINSNVCMSTFNITIELINETFLYTLRLLLK